MLWYAKHPDSARVAKRAGLRKLKTEQRGTKVWNVHGISSQKKDSMRVSNINTMIKVILIRKHSNNRVLAGRMTAEQIQRFVQTIQDFGLHDKQDSFHFDHASYVVKKHALLFEVTVELDGK